MQVQNNCFYCNYKHTQVHYLNNRIGHNETKEKKRTIERAHEVTWKIENFVYCIAVKVYKIQRGRNKGGKVWGHLCPMDTFLAYLV